MTTCKHHILYTFYTFLFYFLHQIFGHIQCHTKDIMKIFKTKQELFSRLENTIYKFYLYIYVQLKIHAKPAIINNNFVNCFQSQIIIMECLQLWAGSMYIFKITTHDWT